MVNGTLVAFLGVPSIVATLGTLSIYRGIDFFIAGGKQVTVGDLPPGYTEWARATFIGVPVFVWLALIIIAISTIVLRQTRSGRQVTPSGAIRKPPPSLASAPAWWSSRCSPCADSWPGSPACCGGWSSGQSTPPRRPGSFSR